MAWISLDFLQFTEFTPDFCGKSVGDEASDLRAMPLRGFPSLALLDGRSMPAFGLGVYRCGGEECYNAVKWALDMGALALRGLF